MNLFDTNFPFTSLIWGSVGIGYWIYGKKQREMTPMLGGMAVIAVPYFVVNNSDSPLRENRPDA